MVLKKNLVAVRLFLHFVLSLNVVNNGCAVCICAVDISKAFDRVNHYKLLDVLMDKSLPRCFIGILLDCVRWGSAYSSWFLISAGVRQGGILSPVLFALYMDPLISQFRHLELR